MAVSAGGGAATAVIGIVGAAGVALSALFARYLPREIAVGETVGGALKNMGNRDLFYLLLLGFVLLRWVPPAALPALALVVALGSQCVLDRVRGPDSPRAADRVPRAGARSRPLPLALLRPLVFVVGLVVVGYLGHPSARHHHRRDLARLSWRLADRDLLSLRLTATLDAAAWRLAFVGRVPPFSKLWSARLAGEAVNATTPTASVGGEPVKAFLLRSLGAAGRRPRLRHRGQDRDRHRPGPLSRASG